MSRRRSGRPTPGGGTGRAARAASRRGTAVTLAAAAILGAVTPGLALTSSEAKQKSFQTLNQGTLLYEQGDYRSAVDLLRQAAGISLNSFQAHYQLGLALREARLYEEALEPLAVALELNPKHLQAHVALGDCHLKLGDGREAEAEYQRALDLQPDYAAAYDGLGRLMEALGRADDGVYYYQRAIEANAGYPDAYLHLGDLYQRQGRLQEAVTLLLKAIQIRPDFASAYNRLGVAYARQHLLQEAVAALREAERLEPKSPYHPFTLGRGYLDLGALRWARESLQKAMELDPTFPEVYVELAALERREGDYEGALSILHTGLGRAGHAESEEMLRTEITRLEKERDRVQRLKEQVARGGNLDPAVTLARHYASVGDYESASRTLDGRIRADRDATALVSEWGYYQIKASRYAEAESTFEALTRRLADDYGAHVNLGIAEAGIGRYEPAMRAYRTALRLKPEAPEATLYLGNLYLRLGELERARESYLAYLKLAGEGEEVGRVRRILELLDRLQGGPGGAAAPERGAGGRRTP